MRRKKLLALLLALALAFSLLPASGLAAAAQPLPRFVALVGQLRWDQVAGADRYNIIGLEDGPSMLSIRKEDYDMYGCKIWNDEFVSFKLRQYMDAVGTYEEKTYHLTIRAANGSQELGYESSLDFNYKSELPLLSTPTNLRWDGKKISWDPVEGAKYYDVCVYEDNNPHHVWHELPKEPAADLSLKSGATRDEPISFTAGTRYHYTVTACASQGAARTARDSGTAISEYVTGGEVLNGYRGLTVAHSITVEGGTADMETAVRGQTVRIRAESREKNAFDGWEIVSGGVTVAAPVGNDTTFLMGAEDVVIRAKFRYIGGYVTEVRVYVDPPKAGETPQDAAVKSERYSVTSTQWTDKATGAALGAGDVFEAGKDYEMRVILASAGLPFAEELPGYVNDSGQGVACQQKGMAVAEVKVSFPVAKAEPAPHGDEPVNPFADVDSGDAFYNAVLWAYYHEPQITKGVDETHFGPLSTVTRGQAVAFLWRAMGEPEPKDLSSALKFTDLRADYYKKAVAWAVENGVTNGVTDTLFAPDDTLSTAHIVTFFYRAYNPGMNGWYEGAAAWAKESGCLDGLEIAVDNRTDCPRKDVVMLLFGLMGVAEK